LGGFVVVAFALSSRLHVPLFPALAPSPLSRYLILHKPTLRFFLVFGLLRNFSSKKYSKIFSTKGDKLNAACRFSDGFHFHVISVAIREVLSAVPISYADFSQTETKTSKKIRVFAEVTPWGQRFGSGHLITWTVFFVLGREW